MKRTLLSLTTILAMSLAACGGDPRPATQEEKAATTTFVQTALALRSDDGAMPALPVTLPAMPQTDASCVARSQVGSAIHISFDCQADGTRVTGSVTHDGDQFTVDLHATGNLTMDYTANLTVRPDLIDGTLTLHAQATGFSATVDATFDHVTLDGAECATGGRLRFDAEATAANQSRARDLEVGFGPACGDVTVYE